MSTTVIRSEGRKPAAVFAELAAKVREQEALSAEQLRAAQAAWDAAFAARKAARERSLGGAA